MKFKKYPITMMEMLIFFQLFLLNFFIFSFFLIYSLGKSLGSVGFLIWALFNLFYVFPKTKTLITKFGYLKTK